MDIICIGQGECGLYYLDLQDGNSLEDFLCSQNELDEQGVVKFMSFLKNTTQVASCPKALGTSVYKKLESNTPGMYEFKKGRMRLICYEIQVNKTVLILFGFVKKDKKQQQKYIKQAENLITTHLTEQALAQANWKRL